MKESEFKTHNEQYEKLQEQYLQTGSKKILGDMYLIIRTIEKRYIYKYLKKHHLVFEDETFEDKVEVASIFVIERYLKNKNFKIDKVSAYCYFGMIKSLFTNKEQEQKECSYEQWLENNSESEID